MNIAFTETGSLLPGTTQYSDQGTDELSNSYAQSLDDEEQKAYCASLCQLEGDGYSSIITGNDAAWICGTGVTCGTVFLHICGITLELFQHYTLH